MDNFYERGLAPRVREALNDSSLVFLNGARQTGKTTLALDLAETGAVSVASYSFDDVATLSAARADAAGFLAGILATASDATAPIVLDEVQHAPELFPALKMWIDRARRRREKHAGRFLLTGSANILLLPKLSESLAGRMEILTLYPLSQSEIEGKAGTFVDALFESQFSPKVAGDGEDASTRILRGGFPEALHRAGAARRKAWFDSYVSAILQRDVRDISNIEGLSALPRLLQFLATRSAGLLNLADVSRATTLPYATLHRYMTLLEATFLIHPLPAWSSRLGSRLVKAPKLMMLDTGMAASLLGIDATRLRNEPLLRGALLENFVSNEMLKLAGWSRVAPRLFHFRTQNGYEVDVVLETDSGQIVGLETKAAAAVTSDDFKGLRHLADIAGEKFVRGIVLYGGEKVVPFGERLLAVPFSALWQ